MTDAVVKRKMNQMANLADELDEEAKRRYGPKAFLFYEGSGYFALMADDSLMDRQKHIRLQSDTPCSMQAGAW